MLLIQQHSLVFKNWQLRKHNSSVNLGVAITFILITCVFTLKAIFAEFWAKVGWCSKSTAKSVQPIFTAKNNKKLPFWGAILWPSRGCYLGQVWCNITMANLAQIITPQELFVQLRLFLETWWNPISQPDVPSLKHLFSFSFFWCAIPLSLSLSLSISLSFFLSLSPSLSLSLSSLSLYIYIYISLFFVLSLSLSAPLQKCVGDFCSSSEEFTRFFLAGAKATIKI